MSSGRTWASPSDELAWPVALGVLGLLALQLQPTGPRAPVRLWGQRVPDLCPTLALTGRRCPSCGMTRGLLYLARGDLRNALRANPLSPVALLLLCARTLLAVARLAPGPLPRPARRCGEIAAPGSTSAL